MVEPAKRSSNKVPIRLDAGGRVWHDYLIAPKGGESPKGMIIMAQFTTTEVAEKFDTTSRTLRKFLRADARSNGRGDTLPGKGSRYAIEGKDLAGLKKRFAAWKVAQAEAAAKRAAEAVEATEGE